MTLKQKLHTLCITLHLLLMVLAWILQEPLGLLLIAVEVILIASLLSFFWLIRKALQPLEYVEIFSSLLKEEEFTNRFSQLNQPDIDALIASFNQLLERLHKERLAAGEQKNLLQKLMQESPVGIVLLDFDQRIEAITPAAEKLLRIQNESYGGQSLYQLSDSRFEPLKSIQAEEQALIKLNDGKQIKVGHFRIRDRGFKRSFFMLYELTGEIHASQKEAYEKLIRLMSHEVNNTIAATNSLLESCLNYKDALPSEERDNYSDAINIAMQRSSTLNHFMQAYANVVKLPKPVKSSFDLRRLVENLSILFQSECQKSNISIAVEGKDSAFVCADPHLIEQALVNIIKNSIEAIQERQCNDDGLTGIIKLTLEQYDNKMELKIIDNGCGINEQTKRHLFTPFFTTKHSGQGLGLMLIQEILGQQDLDYMLSNSDAQGAEFVIRF